MPDKTRQIRRIAVVNRGEAASRCLRAIRELRLEEGSHLVGIALYTDPDRSAPFVREADESIHLGAAMAENRDGALTSAYLDYDRLVSALRRAHADTVWPGWGFVSEHPAFVERLGSEGIHFLGPSSDTMRRLGDKITSKRIAEAAEVPVAPWSGGPVSRESLAEIADQIGFPLVLKATAGGGGRGIRIVLEHGQLATAFTSASFEALNAFGDGTLFAEACVTRARHIEVQMAADKFGGVLAVGVRDCSVQRRHQKVIEEGPPPGVSEETLSRMREASVRLIKQAGYVGVATCEYLLNPDGSFYFLEVNPRLQVEHGVTELLTGFDLVKAQIRIARGERLPESVSPERGAAMEVRLCAENPAADFAPSPGNVALLELPAGPGIRVDSGIAESGVVPSEFDSMIAKILAHGATREEARARLVRALSDTRIVISGGTTNKGFLLDALEHDEFRQGGVSTRWLDDRRLAGPTRPIVDALLIAAIHVYQRERAAARANFFDEASRGRPMNIPASSGQEVSLVYEGVSYRLHVFAMGGWTYRIHDESRTAQVTLLEQGPYARLLVTTERRVPVLVSGNEVEIRVELDGRQHRIECDVGGRIRAPSPSLLIELAVRPGDRVRAGDRLGLFEAMKMETAFHAPVGGTVREVVARAGERLSAGDVILVIEPSGTEADRAAERTVLELPRDPDPLDVFVGQDDKASLARADAFPATRRVPGVLALSNEVRRILLGYDVNLERAERLIEVLSSPVQSLSAQFQSELRELSHSIGLFAEIEVLFSRVPSMSGGDELGPSNDARMAMYLRRIRAKGAGIDPEFLELLKTALAHYGVRSLEQTDTLHRAVLRLYSTRTTLTLRHRLVTALLHFLIQLGETGGDFSEGEDGLSEALERLWLLRGTVTPTVADLAAQARFLLFDRPELMRQSTPGAEVDRELSLVPPPEGHDLSALGRRLRLDEEQVRGLELWRLSNFELERLELKGFERIVGLFGRSLDGTGDERIFCFAEVNDLGPYTPERPDMTLFERRFHEAVEAMRSAQAQREFAHRLHWNRLYVFVRPPITLTEQLVSETLRRLAPETGHLGLERVIVRIATVSPDAPDSPPQKIEVLASNPTGGRAEWAVRQPHTRPLEPAGPYERRVALARSRGLTYPYEIIRLFTSPVADRAREALGRPVGPGSFVEYDLEGNRAVVVDRAPGNNSCGVVFGVISTPTRKYPEGMRRVIIASDPTFDMGALSAKECDRIVAAIDLAESEDVPVEWIAVSAGARIAMDSGTENLDATARVVRRLVTFTDQGGEVNLILPGVNVGAQSYFDALATMGLSTRGILIMLPGASMVLTGKAALQFSGGVSAEDEVGIGGYERIMGPNGEAQYRARDLFDAHRVLLEHYAVTYRAPGAARPRRFESRDPADRDVTLSPYDGDEGYSTIGDIFSPGVNPGRKRPFAMRPLMKALVDEDAGMLERWRDWVDAQTAIVWDSHIGGHPATLIGIESRQIARIGYTPNDGPSDWTAATLFPHSSKKVARALNAASGNRPAVILANLSGFDGSPESMRRGVLEMGAEIARAMVRFEGRIAFVVVTRYHGGAYVVFSRELNDSMRVGALTGSYASVIGGPAAAAVVFNRDVRKRANADARVVDARRHMEATSEPALRAAARAKLDEVWQVVISEKRAEVAAEFDAIHSVERAREVGSLQTILEPRVLRPTLIEWLEND